MPSSNIDLSYAFSLPPSDAVAYFQAKGHKITWNWQEMADSAHAKAFTVAKVARAEVLDSIRSEVDKALNEGLTYSQFANQLTPTLQRQGWWGKQIITDSQGNAQEVQLGSPRRLKTIYRTNLQTAYMSGRYKQQMENSDLRPYWMYVAILDANTRESHSALSGQVFRFDDPIWQSHYPPNGWGCRCRVRSLSATRLKRMGAVVQSSKGKLSKHTVETGIDNTTGEVYQHQVVRYKNGQYQLTPDAGWSHNSGATAFGSDIALMRRLSLVQDPSIRAQAVQALNNNELRQQVFASWVEDTLSSSRAGHNVQTLGFVSEELASVISHKTNQLAPRVLAMGEKQLIHANSKKHLDHGIALTKEEYKRLPALVASASEFYWDNKHKNFLLVLKNGTDTLLLPLNADWNLKKVKGKLDILVNAYRISDDRLLKNKSRFELLR